MDLENIKQKGVKATKLGFGEGLKIAGQNNANLIALGSDITASVGMDLFANAFPDRFYSLGIAEQNAIGVAAGMALCGKIPVFATYGVFSAMRTLDQIRISLCYNNVHAIIGGAHAGISVGPDGATHQALEDIAALRALPNITILSPCDATQTKLATIAAIEKCNGPVYVRFGREPMPDFSNEYQDFEIGKSQMISDGDDLTILATGHLVWESILAVKELSKQGIKARLLNIHSIKPIDKAAIIKAAKETGAILTAEEHQITGGLASAVAEVVVQNHAVPMEFVGMPNTFGESGKAKELMDKYGMNAKTIIQKSIQLINRKK
ncbi:MAG: transketolase family protein [Bacteroidetes bacterium]|nr:MAG: transketolase family protein [Bacteroidota bacterium]